MTDRTLADGTIPFDSVSFSLTVLSIVLSALILIKLRHTIAAAIAGTFIWCAVTVVDKLDRWMQSRRKKD